MGSIFQKERPAASAPSRWVIVEELGDGLVDDLGGWLDRVDQADGLAGQGGRGLHVAAEIDAENALQGVGRHQASVVDLLGALGLQGADAGAGLLVQHPGAGLLGAGDRGLVVVVHRAFGGADEAGAHLHGLGPQGEGGGHAAAVADAARGDQRHVDPGADGLQQHQGRDLLGVLEAAALGALDHQAVDAGLDAFDRRVDGGHGVIDHDPGVLQRPDELGRTAGRGGDERTPLSQTKRSMASSLRNRIGRLTPNGRPLSAILRISALQFSVSPDEVSMTPRPPARETALASG
jgi:hypothetical protein